MIRSVSLSGFPSFGDDEVLNNLTTVNYVFGPNGSGKTTISRSLTPSLNGNDYSHVNWSSELQTVKVYNRDYVNKTFTKAEERGVFLLGEDSKETFNQIKKLQEEFQKAKKKSMVMEPSSIKRKRNSRLSARPLLTKYGSVVTIYLK